MKARVAVLTGAGLLAVAGIGAAVGWDGLFVGALCAIPGVGLLWGVDRMLG